MQRSLRKLYDLFRVTKLPFNFSISHQNSETVPSHRRKFRKCGYIGLPVC